MNHKDYRSKRSHSKEKNYNSKKRRSRSRSRSHEKHNYYKNNIKEHEDDYWEKRRRKREKIMRRPKKRIWSNSPTKDEISEIKREHKKIKELYKKENEEFDEQIKEVVDNTGNNSTDTTNKTLINESNIVNSNDKNDTNESNVIGPVIESEENNRFVTPSKITNYGNNISRNEGAAFAAYISQGKRIPRRGEIGLTSNQISSFEKAGYVMSGSKSLRMEAVRIRKETQVMTAEEQALMKKHNIEARKEEEKKIMDQFKLLIQTKKANK